MTRIAILDLEIVTASFHDSVALQSYVKTHLFRFCVMKSLATTFYFIVVIQAIAGILTRNIMHLVQPIQLLLCVILTYLCICYIVV